MRKIVSIRLHIYFVALFVGYIVFVLPAQAASTTSVKRDTCAREICGEVIDLAALDSDCDESFAKTRFSELLSYVLPVNTAHFKELAVIQNRFSVSSFIQSRSPALSQNSTRAPPVV